jgi:hypothetical protein
MTEYQKVTVDGPKEAFSELKDNFYVKEDNGNEIVLLVEETNGHPVKDDPIREKVNDVCGSLDGFSAFGQPVWNEEDLPPELRDNQEYQEELKRSEPMGKLPQRDTEDMESVLLVLDTIKDNEADSDHIAGLENAIKRLREIHPDYIRIPNRKPRKSDISLTLEILEEEGVEYTLNEHPNNALAHQRSMVLMYARHEDVIPEPNGDLESVF